MTTLQQINPSLPVSLSGTQVSFYTFFLLTFCDVVMTQRNQNCQQLCLLLLQTLKLFLCLVGPNSIRFKMLLPQPTQLLNYSIRYWIIRYFAGLVLLIFEVLRSRSTLLIYGRSCQCFVLRYCICLRFSYAAACNSIRW